jgi:Tol biopolymer transport system component
VAFSSDSTNLVPSDTNGVSDIFVRDTVAGTTARVSIATGGTEANGSSGNPSIGGDGHYVAFTSGASNLVIGDTNSSGDVFLRDTETGTTSLVSVATDGTAGDGSSYTPSMSADGHRVAFYSDASNLVAGDTNGYPDVFVLDTVTGTTILVSVGIGGAPGNLPSMVPFISADGRHVTFGSFASNLVAGDTNGTNDVFVRDLVTGSTALVDASAFGFPVPPNLPSYPSAISADGRYVAFYSTSAVLTLGDTNNTGDAFIRDTLVGTSRRVSMSTDGKEGKDYSFAPSISADGRWVAFTSSATNLVAADTNGEDDIFLRGPLFAVGAMTRYAADGAVSSSPTAVDGVVYFGDDAGKLHAVNTADGTAVSGFPVNISDYVGAAVQIRSRPAVYYSSAGEFIYLTTTRGDVCRVAMDGSSVLHYSDYLGSGNASTPAVTSDGTVYVGLTTPTFSSVFKLNANLSANTIATGLGGSSSTISSVSVADNDVYVGFTAGSNGDIMVLNAANLTPLSSGVATGEGVTAPPYVVGQDMYVGTLAGNFYKLNSANNNVDTAFGTNGAVPVGEPLPTSPFFNTGAFYAGSSNGKVWKIGLDGSLSVAYDTINPRAVVGGVVVERASNTLVFGTNAGDLYKGPLKGEDASNFRLPVGFETTPTYDASTGRFFIGSDDGNVYGF